MTDINHNILDLFTKKINFLIIDDESIVLESLSDMFSSPLFNITTGSNLEQAFKKINAAKESWHCWILDIALEDEDDGFRILEKYPQFPFSIMLSGLRSMTLASQALQKGAMKVFDKDPESLDLLYDEVCKVAALGYILGGKETQYLSHYTLLKEHNISTAEEWANYACISARQLERICTMHTQLTPRFVISLYYTLYSSLFEETSSPASPSDTDDNTADSDRNDSFQSHIDFFERYRTKYQQILFG